STLCHQHIILGLMKRRVDKHIIALIQNMYDNTSTCITTMDEKSAPIKILQGVKQGEALSPLQFNLALDSLLCRLKKKGEGYQHERFKVTAMAFADDLVLLSNSWKGMTHNINILDTFCDLMRLKMQVGR
ncbi:PO21 protein, partial [Pomatorhinus ruficollis]|nr:PO21 protein [Pomatorhinus ruficollis]